MSFALILLAWLIRFLNAMNLVTSSGQSLLSVFRITSLVIPEIAFTVMPITLFIAFMLTIRKLNAHSELSVMVAAGISPLRLARPFFILLFIGAILMGNLSLWVQPYTLSLWRAAVTNAGADLISTLIQPGQFTKLGANMLFHFKDRDSFGNLSGIIVKDTSKKNTQTMYFAQKGQLVRSEERTLLILKNGSIQDKDHQQGVQNTIITFDEYGVDFSKFSNTSKEVRYKIREYSNKELHAGIQENKDPQLTSRLNAEWHMRVSAPLYIIAFGMITMGFLLSAQSTRESKWEPIAGAIVITLIVRIYSLNFISAANKDNSLILAIYALALVPILFSFLQISGLVNLAFLFKPIRFIIKKISIIIAMIYKLYKKLIPSKNLNTHQAKGI